MILFWTFECCKLKFKSFQEDQRQLLQVIQMHSHLQKESNNFGEIRQSWNFDA
jgi:hypothetical protein